jgi:hypothetical protein
LAAIDNLVLRHDRIRRRSGSSDYSTNRTAEDVSKREGSQHKVPDDITLEFLSIQRDWREVLKKMAVETEQVARSLDCITIGKAIDVARNLGI